MELQRKHAGQEEEFFCLLSTRSTEIIPTMELRMDSSSYVRDKMAHQRQDWQSHGHWEALFPGRYWH